MITVFSRQKSSHIQWFRPFFEEFGVDAYIGGHDHLMQVNQEKKTAFFIVGSSSKMRTNVWEWIRSFVAGKLTGLRERFLGGDVGVERETVGQGQEISESELGSEKEEREPTDQIELLNDGTDQTHEIHQIRQTQSNQPSDGRGTQSKQPSATGVQYPSPPFIWEDHRFGYLNMVVDKSHITMQYHDEFGDSVGPTVGRNGEIVGRKSQKHREKNFQGRRTSTENLDVQSQDGMNSDNFKDNVTPAETRNLSNPTTLHPVNRNNPDSISVRQPMNSSSNLSNDQGVSTNSPFVISKKERDYDKMCKKLTPLVAELDVIARVLRKYDPRYGNRANIGATSSRAASPSSSASSSASSSPSSSAPANPNPSASIRRASDSPPTASSQSSVPSSPLTSLSSSSPSSVPTSASEKSAPDVRQTNSPKSPSEEKEFTKAKMELYKFWERFDAEYGVGDGEAFRERFSKGDYGISWPAHVGAGAASSVTRAPWAKGMFGRPVMDTLTEMVGGLETSGVVVLLFILFLCGVCVDRIRRGWMKGWGGRLKNHRIRRGWMKGWGGRVKKSKERDNRNFRLG